MVKESSIQDRRSAGRELAKALQGYGGRDDLLVLALPRGGVPVASEVARALEAPLDLLVVRKLGLPKYPELAMGAIAGGGVQVMNEQLVNYAGVSEEEVAAVVERERRELERRERAYRGDRPRPDIKGRCVILVDDGLATGATMSAAIEAVRRQGAKRIVVAVPVAPPEFLADLEPQVDDVVCPLQPQPFMSVGQWYRDFHQVSDAEVRGALERSDHSSRGEP